MMDRSGPALLLHVDFETQALLTPGAIALHYAGATITYAELAQQAARVASALSRHGIGAGCYVGLHVDRSIDYVASVLGILKANAAVVPLPPAHPRARLTGILEFAKLDAVVDHDDTPLAPVSGTRVLRFADLVAETGNTATLARGNPDQPAFVLASSGSTGKPKLIVRSHRSFYHRLCWTWANHPYGPDERCVQKSTMTTTHAIYELFEPLLRGVPTLVLGDPESRDLKGFWETINAWSITRLLVVPSALQVSMEFPGFAVPALKVVVLMGEYVHQRLAARAIEVFPAHTSLYSIYGSTEASSTLVCDLRESYRPNQELPLGRPISPDVQAYVLGEDLVPVGSGATGLLLFCRYSTLYGVLQGPDADGLRLRTFARNERPSVRHARPGPAHGRRQHRVSRPDRSHGQGARLPRRHPGSRAHSAAASVDQSRRGRARQERCRRGLADRVLLARNRDPRQRAQLHAGTPASLHDSVDSRRPGGAATHGQRQDGSTAIAGRLHRSLSDPCHHRQPVANRNPRVRNLAGGGQTRRPAG